MNMFVTLQYLVFGALSFACFGVEIWAFIDAIRRPAGAYLAEGKRTKPIWATITGVSVLVGFLGLPPANLLGGFGGLLSIVAVVAALVYLVSVRPAVKRHGFGKGGPKSGGPSSGTGRW